MRKYVLVTAQILEVSISLRKKVWLDQAIPKEMCLMTYSHYDHLNMLINKLERRTCLSQVNLEMCLNLQSHQSKSQIFFCHLKHPTGLRSWDRFSSDLYASISSVFAFNYYKMTLLFFCISRFVCRKKKNCSRKKKKEQYEGCV